MCLILIAHQIDPERPLLVLANRDEFYDRPSAAAALWEDVPGLVAGRDLVSDGSWFGARGERWATVTNVREGRRNEQDRHSSRSRGWLVRDFLTSTQSPHDFIAAAEEHFGEFAGFNLLLGDAGELYYASNRLRQPVSLQPGLYGLSNHLLDTPWPKVVRGKVGLKRLLQDDALDETRAFELLADTTLVDDAELPETGVPLAWERGLSAIFVRLPRYGTRSSTLLTRGADSRCLLVERRFDRDPGRWQESRFAW
jgi:uncharacterized protein with NRDE domain